MAQIDTTGLQELISDMRRMGEASGPVARAMTAAAAEEISASWRQTAEAYGLRDTGAMIESIGWPEGVQALGDIFAADIYPQGRDARGVRNAEKAFIQHYGSSRIRPTYWVDEADKKAADPVQRRLEEIWGQFLETGQVPSVPEQYGGSGRGGTRRRKV